MRRTLKALAESGEHDVTYHRRRLGSGAISGRPLYGYAIECSCGWSKQTNEAKAGAVQWWREHLRVVQEQER